MPSALDVEKQALVPPRDTDKRGGSNRRAFSLVAAAISAAACLALFAAVLRGEQYGSGSLHADITVGEEWVSDLWSSAAPVTVPYAVNLRSRSNPIALNDRRLARAVRGLQPEQRHLTYVSHTAVAVSWVMGEPQSDHLEAPPLNCSSVRSLVQFGLHPGRLTHSTKGRCETYRQLYTFKGARNYTSPLLHHAMMEGLKPETTYYYRVGDLTHGFSGEARFTTAVAPGGPAAFPVRLGVIGDAGQTPNTSATLEHLVAARAGALLLLGDFSYADQHLTDGQLRPEYRGQHQWAHEQTHQARWDSWGRLMEPLLSGTPLLQLNGNHEEERQAGGATFVAYNARYPVPAAASNSSSNLYYSWRLGGVAGLMLSPYAAFGRGSQQRAWLAGQLAAVDRRATPWLLAAFHCPWYHTYAAHYKECDCMRQALEGMLYGAGVDIILAGHVHAYERTRPMFNYSRDACGPVHITAGDGGNMEGLVVDFVDSGPHHCPSAPKSHRDPECVTQLDESGDYCPHQQPEWSAFREPSFGHGVLQFVNATHAFWAWHRNQDGAAKVSDGAWIVRNMEGCKNRL